MAGADLGGAGAHGGELQIGGTGGSDEIDTGGQGGASADLPALTHLAVKGTAGELNPAFSPEVHRYSVREADPARLLEVTVGADADMQLALAGQAVESGEPIPLENIVPGAEVEIVVANDAGRVETYVIVYLPNEFPELSVTALKRGVATDPIYTETRIHGNSDRYAMKLDNNAVPFFYRHLPSGALDFKRHANGVMSIQSGSSRALLDDNYMEFHRVRAVGLDHTDHHDFEILSNGNFLLFALEEAAQDLTPWGGESEFVVEHGVIQEVTPDGALAKQWHSWDHMSYGHKLVGDASDYVHLNSIDVDGDGNWLISSRSQSQLLKIDHTTGEIIWRLGGVNSDFDYVDDPLGGHCGQHHAKWLSNGHILMLDNGNPGLCYPKNPDRPGTARAVEYALDENTMTARMVWSYNAAFPVQTQGSAQRLANGNTIMGWGGVSSEYLASEVDADGNVLWELKAHSEFGVVMNYRTTRWPD